MLRRVATDRRQEIRHAMYVIAAADAAAGLVAVFLSRLFSVALISAVCLPMLLVFNVLFLRYKLRVADRALPAEATRGRPRGSYLYACSAIFFVGTIYGLLMTAEGELPRIALPLLLVPLTLAIYCLRTVLKAKSRNS